MSSFSIINSQSRFFPGSAMLSFGNPSHEEILKNLSLASMDIPSVRASSIHMGSDKSNMLKSTSFNQLISASINKSLPPGIIQNILSEEKTRMRQEEANRKPMTSNFDNPYYDNSSLHNKLPRSFEGIGNLKRDEDALDTHMRNKGTQLNQNSPSLRREQHSGTQDQLEEGNKESVGTNTEKRQEPKEIESQVGKGGRRLSRSYRLKQEMRRSRFVTAENEVSIEKKMNRIKVLEGIVSRQHKEPGLKFGLSSEEAELKRLKRQVDLDQVWDKQIQKHSRDKYKELIRNEEEDNKIEAKLARDREELRLRFEQEKKRESSIESDKHKRRNSKPRILSSIRGRSDLLSSYGRAGKKQEVSPSQAESSGSEGPHKTEENAVKIERMDTKKSIDGESEDPNKNTNGPKEKENERRHNIYKGKREMDQEHVEDYRVKNERKEEWPNGSRPGKMEKEMELRESHWFEKRPKKEAGHPKRTERDTLADLKEISEKNMRSTRARILNQAENYKMIGSGLHLSLDLYDRLQNSPYRSKNPYRTPGHLQSLDSNHPNGLHSFSPNKNVNSRHFTGSEPLQHVPEHLSSVFDPVPQFIPIAPPSVIKNAKMIDSETIFSNENDRSLEQIFEEIDIITKIHT